MNWQSKFSFQFFSVPPKNSDTRILLHFGIFSNHFFDSFNEIIHTLTLICHTLRNKEYQPFILWKAQSLASRLFVLWFKEMCVNRIRNTSNANIAQKSTHFCLSSEPMTTSNKPHITMVVDALLTSPHLCRQIIRTASTR